MDQRVRHPNVVVFPRDDRAFRAHVEWAVENLDPAQPEQLQEQLSDAYPEVRVQWRIGLADLGGDRAWYVYRDGSAVTSTDADWWTRPDIAEFHIDATGSYVSANAAAAELLGRSIGDIVGKRVGSFTRHEAAPEPGLRAFAVLAETGCLESTAVVVRPDRAEVLVRYRVTGHPAGGYRMVMIRR